jgi:hypothetical protein
MPGLPNQKSLEGSSGSEATRSSTFWWRLLPLTLHTDIADGERGGAGGAAAAAYGAMRPAAAPVAPVPPLSPPRRRPALASSLSGSSRTMCRWSGPCAASASACSWSHAFCESDRGSWPDQRK